jgi:hypothetical protein
MSVIRERIGLGHGEVAIDQVGDARKVGRAAPAPSGREAVEPRPHHQKLHLAMADTDAAPEHELCVDAPGAVGSARGDVDLADEVGEPGMPDRAL